MAIIQQEKQLDPSYSTYKDTVSNILDVVHYNLTVCLF